MWNIKYTEWFKLLITNFRDGKAYYNKIKGIGNNGHITFIQSKKQGVCYYVYRVTVQCNFFEYRKKHIFFKTFILAF